MKSDDAVIFVNKDKVFLVVSRQLFKSDQLSTHNDVMNYT